MIFAHPEEALRAKLLSTEGHPCCFNCQYLQVWPDYVDPCVLPAEQKLDSPGCVCPNFRWAGNDE
jgi:hypothetical protein